MSEEPQCEVNMRNIIHVEWNESLDAISCDVSAACP